MIVPIITFLLTIQPSDISNTEREIAIEGMRKIQLKQWVKDLNLTGNAKLTRGITQHRSNLGVFSYGEKSFTVGLKSGKLYEYIDWHLYSSSARLESLPKTTLIKTVEDAKATMKKWQDLLAVPSSFSVADFDIIQEKLISKAIVQRGILNLSWKPLYRSDELVGPIVLASVDTRSGELITMTQALNYQRSEKPMVRNAEEAARLVAKNYELSWDTVTSNYSSTIVYYGDSPERRKVGGDGTYVLSKHWLLTFNLPGSSIDKKQLLVPATNLEEKFVVWK